MRVAGPNASLRLNDVVMTDNQALERGGAIACENCKRLDIGGMFQIQDNSAGVSELTEGGAIWTDSPTKIVGAARPLAGFGPARITENNANPLVGDFAFGGAILTKDDLTIKNVNVSNNSVFGTGRGGAITAYVPSEGLDLKLDRVTLAENNGSSRGGAVDMSGLGGVGRLVMNKVAVLDNFAGGFGGGVFTQSDAKITDSVFDGNSLFGQSQDSAQGGGFYSNSGNAVQANSVRFNRTSVTNDELTFDRLTAGRRYPHVRRRPEPGEHHRERQLRTPCGRRRRRVFATQNGNENGSLDIHFSTFRENTAGAGATDGDALYANFVDNPPSITASIIDEASDGCKVSGRYGHRVGWLQRRGGSGPGLRLERPHGLPQR